jgi:hypothetical protein
MLDVVSEEFGELVDRDFRSGLYSATFEYVVNCQSEVARRVSAAVDDLLLEAVPLLLTEISVR